MNDVDEMLVTAIKGFISDVEKSGEEFLTVEIDREDDECTISIGEAGMLSLPCENGEADYIAADYIIAILASAVDDQIGIEASIKTMSKDLTVMAVKYKPECLAH